MQIPSVSAEDYISQIPEERQVIFREIFNTINDHLPHGFSQGSSYGMIGWAVPLKTILQGTTVHPVHRCHLSVLHPRKIS